MGADLLRHLYVFHAVAERGGVRRSCAAGEARVPSTLTRAIASLERLLATALFERTARGMRLTAAGGLAWTRAGRIAAALAAVHAQAQASGARTGAVAALPTLFNERRLQLAVALAEHGRMPAVARSCSVSQPAVSQAIARLETDLGQPLFVRSPGCMAPTALGLGWIACFARVLEEVQGLRHDLAGAGQA